MKMIITVVIPRINTPPATPTPIPILSAPSELGDCVDGVGIEGVELADGVIVPLGVERADSVGVDDSDEDAAPFKIEMEDGEMLLPAREM